MKAWFTIINFFLMFCWGGSSFAQIVFDKHDPEPSIRNLTSTSLSQGAGFFLAGEKYGQNSPGDIQLYLKKIDHSGKEEWIKEYGGGENEFWGFLTPCHEGGVAILGQTYSNTAGYDDALIIRVDEAGNEKWTATVGDTEGEWVRDIIQTSDGGFLILGETVRGNGADLSQFWLFKLSSSGALLWEKVWGGPAFEMGGAVVQLPDAGFLVTGSSQFHQIDHFYLARLNSMGDTLWTKNWPFTDDRKPGTRPMGWDITPTPEGTFLIAGWPILEVTDQGEILWEVTDHFATHICLTEDNTIWTANPSYLYRYDRSGNHLQTLEFPNLILNDLQLTPEGGLFLAGNDRDFNGIRYIRTNCKGEVIQDWSCSDPEEHTPHLSEFSVTLSPNPSRGDFQITLAGKMPDSEMELVITDTKGSIIYTQPYTAGTHFLSLSHLAPGLYHYRAANQVGKVVIAR